MTDPHPSTDTEDWPDRLIDQALREAVGGEQPPDLTARILTAAAAAPPLDSRSETMADAAPSPQPPAASHPESLRFGWAGLSVAASVAFLCGVLLATEIQRNQPAPRVAAIDPVDAAEPTTTDPPGASGNPGATGNPDHRATEFEGADEVGLNGALSGEGEEEPSCCAEEPEQEALTSEAAGTAVSAPPAVPRPIRAEPPIVYPDAEVWEGLANRKARYARVERAKPASVEPSSSQLANGVGGREWRGRAGGQAGLPAVDMKGEDRNAGSARFRDGGGRIGLHFFDTAPEDLNSDGDADGADWMWSVEEFVKNDKAEPKPAFLADLGEPSPLQVSEAVRPRLQAEREALNDRLALFDRYDKPESDDLSELEQLAMTALGREIELRRRRLERGEELLKEVEGRGPGQGGDKYTAIHENPFVETRGEQALSTFSIDVDTASYANVRQFLNADRLPPADAVRLEELVNYFDYGYAPPEPVAPGTPDEGSPAEDAPAPFAAHLHVDKCPWKPAHRVVRIGVKGRELADDKRPLTNLVFLIDVSGSMNDPAKHTLVIEGLKALTKELGENDRVAIVVYASNEGLALPSVGGDNQEQILAALDNLRAGGSTAGGAGIRLAYQIAEENFIEGGANRVILCTDGDFNVGATSTAELERLVAEKAKETGVFLSVCGFGRGNLNDTMMETISGKGNGEYYYIDSMREAEKVFVKGLTGTLVTIAKDVKIQVEFNPARVAGYRLLGYENRMLRAQDFNDDKKDAGEIGAGHTVTALYEIVPTGEEVPAATVDELKYQRTAGLTPEAAESPELLTLKMRYKQPNGDTSTKLEWPLPDLEAVADADVPAGVLADTRFATAVAGFGMLLRNSQHKGDLTFAAVEEIAQSAASAGPDPEGEKAEFLELVRKAKKLRGE